MNMVAMTGRLTRDVELRTTTSGVSVASFSIAVDRDYKSATGERQTDFFRVQAWRASGEFAAKYFSKGMKVEVTGSLQTDKYTDRQGTAREGVVIVADRIGFAESKRNGQEAAQDASAGFEAVDDDDLPF